MMDRRVAAILSAMVLAFLVGVFLLPPDAFDSGGIQPIVLVAGAAATIGLAHGLTTIWLSGRIAVEHEVDLIRWVALPYAFVVSSFLLGFVFPGLRTLVALILALLLGIVVPLVYPRLVIRE